MKKIFFIFAALFFAGLCCGLLFTSCGRSGGARSGRPPEIKVAVFDRGTDGGKTNPTGNNWTKWIQEKLLQDENIKVTFVSIPRWSETTALNNLMAAGTPPDVCVSYSSDLINNYRDLGGLLDLAPYIDTTLKDLKEFLGPDKALPGRELIRRNEDPATKKYFPYPPAVCLPPNAVCLSAKTGWTSWAWACPPPRGNITKPYKLLRNRIRAALVKAASFPWQWAAMYFGECTIYSIRL